MKSVLFPAIALTATLLIGAGCCSGKTAQPDVGSTAAKEAQPDVGFTAEEADRFPSGGSKVLLSLSFEGKVPFDMPQGYSVVPAVGVNGTSALKFARQSNKVGEYIAIPIEGVVPGVRYQLRAKVRGKVVNAPGSKQKKPVVCGIEYRVNGKPREVLYPLKPIPENYEDFTMDFMARANGYEPNLVLYLWHDWSGEVFFDDVEIRSAGPDVSALLLEPANLTFRNGDRKFAVHIDPRSPLPAAVLVTLKQNGKTYRKLLTGMDERFNFRGELPELVPGEAELTFKVIDVKQRCTLHTGSFKVSMLPPDAKAPANAATFDRHGRLIVDGKPFMVLGVFGMSGETDLKRISEAGFNCLQLYASLSLQGNRKLPTTRENVISGMDLIQKYGLKLLFSTATQIPGHGGKQEWDGVKGVQNVSLHAVRMVKDHPALLGYYISDECPRDVLPYLRDTREKISAIDPWHPVWTLTYRLEDLPVYNTTGDVLSVDPYPIQPRAKEQTLQPIVDAMRAAHRGGQPVWLVPQIFNWVYYNSKDPAKVPGTRGPTLKEMRAMPLLGAIMGARGFVFFSYTGIYFHGERMNPGSAAKDWPNVVSMVGTLKSLDKYILSIAECGEVKISGSDRVMARAFRAEDGSPAVIVVSLDSKPVKATLKLPFDAELRSRFGLCRKIAPGVYEYSADGIDSDILEL